MATYARCGTQLVQVELRPRQTRFAAGTPDGRSPASMNPTRDAARDRRAVPCARRRRAGTCPPVAVVRGRQGAARPGSSNACRDRRLRGYPSGDDRHVEADPREDVQAVRPEGVGAGLVDLVDGHGQPPERQRRGACHDQRSAAQQLRGKQPGNGRCAPLAQCVGRAARAAEDELGRANARQCRLVPPGRPCRRGARWPPPSPGQAARNSRASRRSARRRWVESRTACRSLHRERYSGRGPGPASRAITSRCTRRMPGAISPEPMITSSRSTAKVSASRAPYPVARWATSLSSICRSLN